jgi:tetratricopeptide (TPR) repeat protein
LRTTRPSLFLFLATLISIGASFALYAKGLGGTFVFDDWANLPALGAQGPIDTMDAFLRYITSGTADPTGRPIALLSFLIDATNWPASPLPFKRTNLLLHAGNGALLISLLWRLGAALKLEQKQRAVAAWFGGSAWLLHPMFVSTTLYIVQREAMLPATFALLGFHVWLTGRQRFALSGHGTSLVVGGIWLFTLLAFLSKANGLLLPLLVAVIESCLPALDVRRASYQRLLVIACAPWMAAVGVGIGWYVFHGIANATPSFRGWSIGQRLITEPAILWNYIGQLALVIPATGSVFHDQYAAASDLLHPWWTVPAILACLGAVVLAWRYRRTHPSVALGVLFFFAGHLMESTSLPLELYFEHRNYLPAMMLFWPIGIWLGSLQKPAWGMAIACLLLGTAGWLSFNLATLWGQPAVQALTWAGLTPDSGRAQAYAAQMDASTGHTSRAWAKLHARRSVFATEPQVALTLLDLRCSLGGIQTDDLDFAAKTLTRAPRDPGKLLLNWANSAVDAIHDHTCPGLDNAALERLLAAAAANPSIASVPGRMQDITHARGRIELAAGRYGEARKYFDDALAIEPRPGAALEQAALLGRAGAPRLGVGHLDFYATLPPPSDRGPSTGMAWVHDKVLSRQNYWSNEIRHLRAVLLADERNHPE